MRFRLISAAIVMQFVAVSAHADFAQDWRDCSGNDDSRSVAGCTALIDSGSVAIQDRSHVYYNRGISFTDLGEYDRAIADYTQAIRLKPDYSEAYNNRGNDYYRKGAYDLAKADFDQAIRLNPNNAEAYNGRGNVYFDRGAYDLAIASYNRLIQLKPTAPVAYYDRGNAYEKRGAYDTAIADLDRAIGLKPDYADAYANRGIFRWTHYANAESAAADIEHALALNPNLSFARLKLGEIRNAQSAQKHRQSGEAIAGKRVALVIGNSDYTYLPHLTNAVGDARAVATALHNLGYEVQAYYDLSGERLKQVLDEFGSESARTAETALIWYSGHGRSFNISKERRDQTTPQSDDFIVPVDFAPGDDILAKGITVGGLKSKVLPASKLEIVVVDACRPVDIQRTRKGLSENSQPVAAGPGITPILGNLLVVYSTQPDRMASDGPVGGHSPFAQAFLDEVASDDAKNDVRGFFGAVAHKTEAKSKALGSDQRPDVVDDIATGTLLAL